MTCLDTSVLIDLCKSRRGEASRAARAEVARRARAGETLATTRLNVAELLVGVARSEDAVREQERVDRLLGPLTILEFDARAAEAFGRIVGHLLRRGRPIGDMDALIAAVCLSSGHRLLTGNPRHFTDVPGLVVESC
ncbi:MAG: type II toxin-antitoxin system VapC family toxin [Planctomycetes bacterium]|jgi:tRNA(fMet)-specific endonuclease VapC|nr:type II toxin-antitoxin system VapC family toxin [Planctomycetota bacterium]